MEDETEENNEAAQNAKINSDENVDSLEALWHDDTQDNENADDDVTEDLTAQAEEMRELIEQGIDNFSIDDSLIPEDFNPNDPRQLKQVLVDTQKKAIEQTMQMVFKPIALIMQDSEHKMQRIVQEALSKDRGAYESKQLLERELPIVNDRKVGGVVKTIYDRALTKTNDARKAIELTKRSLEELGINTKGHKLPKNDRNPESGGRVLSFEDFMGNLDSTKKLLTEE